MTAGVAEPEAPGSERLADRVLGAVLFVVVFLGCLYWGALPFTLAVAAAAAIGAAELFNMFENHGAALPTVAGVGIAGSIAYVVLAHFHPLESFGYVTAALVFLVLAAYIFFLRQERFTRAAALTLFASILTGFCMSHLVMLRDLAGGSIQATNRGWGLVLFMMALIWLYDVGAWAAGRKFGRRRIAPVLSPNKSLEGTIAGTVVALGVAVPLRLLVNILVGHEGYPWFSNYVAVAIALLVCLMAPLGDIAESMIKRDYGVKDLGSLIPGHGGIMDRLDSTLFTAPAVFYLLYYLVITP